MFRYLPEDNYETIEKIGKTYCNMKMNGDNISQKDISQWDSIWKKQGLLRAIVDCGRRIYSRFFLAILCKKVTKKSDIVELGCGTSSITLQLHQCVNSITGVDLSTEALVLSELNAGKIGVKNFKLLQGDCRKLKIKDETFDLVWSQGLLEHFSRPEEVLQEHIRICKNNGNVVISVPAQYSFFYVWYVLTHILHIKRLWPWTEQDFYTKDNLLNILKRLNYDTNHGVRIYAMKPFFLGILILEINKSQLVKLESPV
jgi:ubiquinone/menaquinone biosynthesis C-methylase UbiE